MCRRHLLATVTTLAVAALLAGCAKEETPADRAVIERPAPPSQAAEEEPKSPERMDLGEVPPAKEAASLVSASGLTGGVDESLANEVNAALDRALDWLAAAQKEDGSWSNGSFPALTALPLQAFAQGTHPRREEVMDRAVKYILSCVNEDGGIYRNIPGRKGGGLSNYNTAICMTALHATGNRSLAKVIQDARTFVAGGQHFGDDTYAGGFGYDNATKRTYTDLLNTYYSAEAMRVTADVEDLRPKGEQRVDIDWTATVKYIERMQNKPASGEADAGGFFYKPGESKAGTTTNAAGTVVLRSYGSITYVGLLALVYANVSRDDVRVRSAFDWASRHWTLDENPGMGAQGLYFFFNIITKSLTAYGADAVPLPDGTFLNWRKEMAKKLVAAQKTDGKTGHGYWTNDAARFWEGDPVLATSYSVMALQALQP
ncbi:MAG: terpene cyclase/mutase family protein [Lentisphaerae bacterium]|nr:terpene cyclase/mutase family protein [Lentisphaerota bacterium]